MADTDSSDVDAVDAPNADHHDEPVAPSTGSVVRDRFSSDEVFQRIIADADHEITSSARELFFSALAGGFAITITVLLYASMYAEAGGGILAVLLYPLGFIYIIIGGYQLYTENTLPPVALTLERLASIPALLRHWTIVALGNFAGGAVGALVLAYTGVLDPAAADALVGLAEHGVETSRWDLFFKGAFAGLVVAGVVWVDFASRDTISRLVVVYLAFLAIPLGNLFHSVVSFTEAVYLMLEGEIGVAVGMLDFVLPVLIGNTVGGVVLVTVVNYYQTSDRRLEIDRFENVRKLSLTELAFGRVAGRSYVPLFDPLGEVDVGVDPDDYHVMVPVSNPRTDTALVDLACTVASGHEDATVHAVHVVQAPDELNLEAGSRQHRRIVKESDRQMEQVREVGAEYDVGFQSSTIVSHRSFEDVFDAAERVDPDIVIMGWGEGQLWDAARAERPLDQLTTQLPCDFLIVEDNGIDTSRILLPTAGGPDSELSGEVAATLQNAAGAEVSLLHIVDDPAERELGEQFLADWADEHGLEDVDLLVDDSGNVEDAIVRAAEDHTFLMLGATERGLLRRLVTDSLHLDVSSRVDCSVGLTERPTDRTLRERLFGRR